MISLFLTSWSVFYIQCVRVDLKCMDEGIADAGWSWEIVMLELRIGSGYNTIVFFFKDYR